MKSNYRTSSDDSRTRKIHGKFLNFFSHFLSNFQKFRPNEIVQFSVFIFCSIQWQHDNDHKKRASVSRRLNETEIVEKCSVMLIIPNSGEEKIERRNIRSEYEYYYIFWLSGLFYIRDATFRELSQRWENVWTFPWQHRTHSNVLNFQFRLNSIVLIESNMTTSTTRASPAAAWVQNLNLSILHNVQEIKQNSLTSEIQNCDSRELQRFTGLECVFQLSLYI